MLEAIVLPPVLKKMGYPRLIISGFLLILFIMTPFVGISLPMQITNIINRFSWNAVLVLAMVPMIHSGCGLNFWPACWAAPFPSSWVLSALAAR